MESLLKALRASADPTRLRLLALCGRSELAVNELVRILGQSQPRVSRHLKVMHEAGLLERSREGSWVLHRIARTGPNAPAAARLAALISDDEMPFSRDLEVADQVIEDRNRAAAAYFRKNAASWNDIRSLHIDEGQVERAILDLMPGSDIAEFLDIGTGTGRMLEIFGPRIRFGLGIDLSHEMLNVARAGLGRAKLDHCEVRLADMYQLPMDDCSFDAISFHQVLHFADAPGRAIAEAFRVLRPGGHMVIADFAPHEREELRRRHNHRRLGLGTEEVAAWCLDAGLEEIRIRHLEGDPLTVTLWLWRRSPVAGGGDAGANQFESEEDIQQTGNAENK